jgi:non-heme chloroperoxidase
MVLKKVLLNILIFVVISVVIYFSIAAVLINIGKFPEAEPAKNNLAFNELYFDYSDLPALQEYKARDGKSLYYRYYTSESDKVLVLLHGSGWHSSYFLPLARFISSQNLAQVYTPDLRGHGPAPERRGDIDYIDQFEDDLADFIQVVRRDNPEAMLIMGGHSSGGGLALRFAGSEYGSQADAYLLLSPFLKYNAPTVRPDSGGWASVNTLRIAGLSMLNNVGIRWFNDLPVIRFNMPGEARDGTETLEYTYRLNTGYAPDNYKKDLAAIKQPLLVVAGTADESFYADRFEPVMSQYTDVEVVLLPDVTHMGVVVGDEVHDVIREWLESLNG